MWAYYPISISKKLHITITICWYFALKALKYHYYFETNRSVPRDLFFQKQIQI
jgi:hypothetical protein